MRVCKVFLGALLLAATSRGLVARGQEMGAPATSVAGVLRSMASRSGVVFVGSVQRVVPEGGVVEIDFAVQQPLIGVSGTRYVAREWAGRWTGAQQRYRVGQTAMFFLHAPSVSGLSSPVDGMMGVVPLIQTGAKQGAMVDLRWLATCVKRAVGEPLTASDNVAMTLADAANAVSKWQLNMPEPVLSPMPGGEKVKPNEALQGEGSPSEQDGVPQLLKAPGAH